MFFFTEIAFVKRYRYHSKGIINGFLIIILVNYFRYFTYRYTTAEMYNVLRNGSVLFLRSPWNSYDSFAESMMPKFSQKFLHHD